MIYFNRGDGIISNGVKYHWNSTYRPPELEAALIDGSVMFHGPQSQHAIKQRMRVADIIGQTELMVTLTKMILIEVNSCYT